MNKTCLKLSALIFAGLLIGGCKDDDDVVKPSNEPEFPTTFSELTVEQNKANLEDNGIELVGEMKALKSTTGIKTAISFSNYLNSASPINEDGGRKINSNKAIAIIHSLAALGKGKQSAGEVLGGFRTKEGDYESIQEMYADVAGVYNYNATLQDWDVITEGGDQIVFNFPSTSNGSSNNAAFTIYEYKGVQIASDVTGEEYLGDLPTNVKAEMKVDGVKKLDYTFTATYNDKGEPTAVVTSLSLDDFKFSFDAKNTTAEVSVNYALTKGTKNLIALGSGAKGNFTGHNLYNDTAVDSVVSSASAYFQLMNIKFSSEVNVKDLMAAYEVSSDVHGQAIAWNDFSQFVVYYADSKKKIADLEFYGEEGLDSETYCWETDTNGDGISDGEECYTNDSIDVRLLFADGSKSDLENYTDVGFDDLRSQFEAFADEVESELE